MKKFFFLAALFVAVTLNAETLEVDLSNPSAIGTVATSLNDGELTVEWTVNEAWGASGIELALNNLTDVYSISFEYKGDGAGIGLIPYIRDINGIRWYDADKWASLELTEWTSVTIAPQTDLWDEPDYEYGEQPFNKLGFIANPENPTEGTFALRNIKVKYGQIAPPPSSDSLRYNGEILPINTEFERTQCGEVSQSLNLDEVSGIACSRVTPGYIWMESDNFGDYIIATTETGQEQAMKVNFPNLKTLGIRYWDWEDMCGGVYNGTNYLFIGAFGDNETNDDFYSIVFFEEPAITGGEINIDPKQIHYVYPDGKSHNNEALMYDNVEQVLYIITKVYYDVCQVFSLPMSLDYGTETQTLTYVCDLGVTDDIGLNESDVRCRGFHLVTGADISADGKYVLIKNHNNIEAQYSWILYWEREANESIAQTVKRQPQVIGCYEWEWQGEAICWLDNSTFYTTSDSDGQPPIYKYTRHLESAIDEIDQEPRANSQKLLINGQLYIIRNGQCYTANGTACNL
ncbi:MAG: hypothetical protein IJS82_00065 [Paludibacteraceae bacterium]|nr:hypothetical protein [Paludibacteraceae bacterium]